jgi:hypothetical protein
VPPRRAEHAAGPASARARVPPAARMRANTQAGERAAERAPDPLAAADRELAARLTRPATPERMHATRDADAVVTAVLDALAWLNNAAAALAALRGHDAAMRERIQDRFGERTGMQLDEYLADQLDGPDRVRALSLLTSTTDQDPGHTALARSLYPLPRENDILRILETTPLGDRATLERRYDAAFARLWKGSLRADLAAALSGWAEEKALATLDRDLTEADHLYFFSTGIYGTNGPAVVEIFQRTSQLGGVAAIERLARDWDRFVVARERWTHDDLATAMERELWPEDLERWGYVSAILDAWKEERTTVPVPPARQEKLDLDVAEQTLTAATTGGTGFGAGTDEAQMAAAVAAIREVHERRIARLAAEGRPKELAEARAAWDMRRGELLAAAPAEVAEESADHARVVMLLEGQLDPGGELSPADEMWLALRSGDYAAVDRVVVATWVAGRIGELNEDAMREKRTRIGGQERRLRPQFDPATAMPRASPSTPRVYALVREDITNNVERGSARLEHEMRNGTEETVAAFLNAPGLSRPVRNAVVAAYATRVLGSRSEDRRFRIEDFLRDFAKRFGTAGRYSDIRELVAPPRGAAELLDLAEIRYAASQSGVQRADPQLESAALESRDRLRHLTWEATDLEIRTMADEVLKPEDRAALVKRGARPQEWRNAVAAAEYRRFRARSEDVVAQRRLYAEIVATTMELVAGAVLTAITAGAAAGPMIAALGSTVIGILTREGLLGDQYEATSNENAQRLAVAIGGASLGAVGGHLAEDLSLLADRYPTLAPALQNATQELMSQIGSQTVAAAFDDRVPSVDTIGEHVALTIGSFGAAGLGGAIKGDAGTARRLLIGNITQSVVQAANQDVVDLAARGAGSATGPELLARFGHHGVDAIKAGTIQTLGEIGERKVGAWRARRTALEREAATEAAAARARADREDDPAAALGLPARGKSGRRTLTEDETGLPDTLITLGLRTPREAAEDYRVSLTRAPDRETGVWRDADTGEFIVVQGAEATVGHAWWRRKPEFAGRRMVLIEHYHPGAGFESRIPSAADFAVMLFDHRVARRMGRGGKEPAQSRIRYRDGSGQLRTTEFGYNPQLPEPYWIVFVGKDGKPDYKTFAKAPYAEAAPEFRSWLAELGIVSGSGGGGLATPRSATDRQAKLLDAMGALEGRIFALEGHPLQGALEEALARIDPEAEDLANETERLGAIERMVERAEASDQLVVQPEPERGQDVPVTPHPLVAPHLGDPRAGPPAGRPARIRDLLLEHVFAAMATYEVEGMTERQRDAAIVAQTPAQRRGVRARIRGDQLDAIVKQSVAEDPRLAFLQISRRGEAEPDFWDPESHSWYDLTTGPQWQAHVESYTEGFGQGYPVLHETPRSRH